MEKLGERKPLPGCLLRGIFPAVLSIACVLVYNRYLGMAQQVSVLAGEVNRNWHLLDTRGERHLLTLFHDTVTGARAAMLDYEASKCTGGGVWFVFVVYSLGKLTVDTWEGK